MISVRLQLINAHHAQITNTCIKINATFNVLLQWLPEFALTYAQMVHIWMEKSVKLAMLIVKLVVLHHLVQAVKELSSVIKEHVLLHVLPMLLLLAQYAQTVIAHVLVVQALQLLV